MRTPEERVTELHRRMEDMRRGIIRRKTIGACAGICAACLAAAVGFATMIARTPVQTPTQTGGGATASIFAEHAALGYVVAALAAFCLGVLVTLLCFRLKQRMEKEEKHDDRKL